MSRPLPELTLFLDHCLGTIEVAKRLRESVGATVEVLIEHFAANTPDAEWLAEIGKRGWVVLTRDTRIQWRAIELRALTEAGVAAFVLTAGDLTAAEISEAFVTAYPRMRKLVRDYKVPFIARVNKSGEVRMITAAPRRAGRRKEKG